jgi:peptidylprolyl isomerase
MFAPAMRGSVLLSVVLSLAACSRGDDKSQVSNAAPEQSHAGSGSGGVRKQQIAPPFDLKAPPADATKTASGLVFKKLVSNPAGVAPKRNDTVLITYTGWKQATGETFFTNQGRGTPMPLNLSQTAPGFTEALQQLRTGEKAVLWMPPEIGYKAAPADGKRETLVYEVTVADVQPAPAIPDDVGQAPASATALKSGTKFVIIRPGTGKDNARPYDSVTYNLTAWDSEGKMLDTTERARHPLTAQPYKASTGLAEMLTNLSVGARGRFWIDAEKMVGNGGKPPGGVDKGTLTYEVEITQLTKTEHEPPPIPPDVAKPPADAKKTAKGVFYRLLAKGSGKDPRHPTENDTVKVNYAGWTTDGKMFDSSYLRNEAATFSLHGVIAGWTDGIPLMTPGDKMRFWIPVEMAYKGAPGKPAGMLVFDVELLEIVPQTAH